MTVTMVTADNDSGHNVNNSSDKVNDSESDGGISDDDSDNF